MDIEDLYREIKKFSDGKHGTTDFHQEDFYIVGRGESEFAPLNYCLKKVEGVSKIEDLIKSGFVFDSFELMDNSHFKAWFEDQFSRKFTRAKSKKTYLIREQKSKKIFDAISQIDQSYKVLKEEKILLNGKNLPVQLGEWYAKSIFGLRQEKSSSQRGFDFYLDGKRVEVKVHWSDTPSPKGVKVRRSLIELSEYTIVIYMAKNFMIREVCFLDSEFVIRKFAGKGHTIFLKDPDISGYFFTKSNKQFDKVVNPSALLKYASPNLAMKLSEEFSQ